MSLASRILQNALRLMPEPDREWAAAMQSELAHIDNKRAAFYFALGCYRTAWLRRLRAEHYEPAGRGFVSLCLLIWAAVKLWFGGALVKAGLYPGKFSESTWDRIDISFLQTTLISGSLFVYAGAGFALLTKRWLTLAVCLLGAMVLNSAHFAIIARNGYYGEYSDARLLFSYAVIGEDYFILTVTIVGVFALYWWPKVMAGERPWKAA